MLDVDARQCFVSALGDGLVDLFKGWKPTICRWSHDDEHIVAEEGIKRSFGWDAKSHLCNSGGH